MNNANSVFKDGWQEMPREEALIKVTILLPIIEHIFNRSQNSILGTITSLWARWSGFQFKGRTRYFLPPECPKWLWDSPSLLVSVYWASLLG
jgi:hypothetical protein